MKTELNNIWTDWTEGVVTRESDIYFQHQNFYDEDFDIFVYMIMIDSRSLSRNIIIQLAILKTIK